MLVLALAAVQAALLLAVVIVGLFMELSWGRILTLAVLMWLAGPVVAVLIGGLRLHVPAGSIPAARQAAEPCVEEATASFAESWRVPTDAYGRPGGGARTASASCGQAPAQQPGGTPDVLLSAPAEARPTSSPPRAPA